MCSSDLTAATGTMVEFVFTPDKLPLPTVAGAYRLDAALMHKGEAMLSLELVELSVLPGPPRALRLADSCAAAYADPWRTRVLTVEEVHAGAQGLAALEGHILDRWVARIQTYCNIHVHACRQVFKIYHILAQRTLPRLIGLLTIQLSSRGLQADRLCCHPFTSKLCATAWFGLPAPHCTVHGAPPGLHARPKPGTPKKGLECQSMRDREHKYI